MAWDKPPANSGQLAFRRAKDFIAAYGWKPQRDTSDNAILNYAYASLESELRIKAVAEGFDPTIGIMHEGRDGSSKYVFDIMEPERPKVDRAILKFVQSETFHPADFVITMDGICRLNPELARTVVSITLGR